MTVRTVPEPPGLPTTTERRPAPTAAPRDRRVWVGAVVLACLSVGGAIISVAGGLSSTIWEAMGPTGRLSIPIPMMLAQHVDAEATATHDDVVGDRRAIDASQHRGRIVGERAYGCGGEPAALTGMGGTHDHHRGGNHPHC